MRSKTGRWGLPTLLCALLLAACVACGMAPATARADEASGSNGPDVTLYVVENCAECGGTHAGDYQMVGGLEIWNSRIDYVSVDEGAGVIAAEKVLEEYDEGGVAFHRVKVSSLKPGTATVSVHHVDREGNPNSDVNYITVEVKSVSNPADLPETYSTSSVKRYAIDMADPFGGLSDAWITSDKIMSQSVLDTIAENPELDYELGESVMLGDGQDYTFMGWAHDGYSMDLGAVPSEDAFSNVSAAFSEGAFTHYYDCPIRATWNPSPETGVYEPWAPGSGNELLPYVRTADDSILSFVNMPELGEWYKLDFSCGEGVSYNGVVYGGSSRTMTIERTFLDADDPLFDANAYTEGPVWVRGDNGGDWTSVMFTIPATGGVNYRLEPADAGTVAVNSVGDGMLGLRVQLDKPATLVVEPSDTVTISNESGASLTVPATSSDPNFYHWLTLETTWLDDAAAQEPFDALVSAVDGVTKAYVYDISLLGPDGVAVQPLEGDAVAVTLPIPEGLSADGLRVFHVADDGTVTDMGATVDAGARTVTFTTTHFSTFVLANVGGQPDGEAVPETKPAGEKNVTEPSGEAVPATGDAGSAAALLAAGSGAAALLGSRALRRRRG